MHPSDPVNRFMTEPAVSIALRSPAAEVLRLFSAHPFHHLPVVEDAKVVGMLSSADVLKVEAFLPKDGRNPADFLNQRLHIDQLMRKPPITVSGTMSVETAADLMIKHGIHALPVVDVHDHLLGILTTTDIINAVLHANGRSAVSRIGTTSEGGAAAPLALSPTAMREAAQLAAKAADCDDDCGRLARALLHAQARLRVLDNVLVSAERYVHAGQDQTLHGLLLKAIARAKEGGTDSLGDWL